jgi:hypothetical protein
VLACTLKDRHRLAVVVMHKSTALRGYATVTNTRTATFTTLAWVIISERLITIITVVEVVAVTWVTVCIVIYITVAVVLVIGITAVVTVETVILPAILAPVSVTDCMRVIITHSVLATLASATAIPAVPVTANLATTHTINRVGCLAIIASESTICAVRMLVDD